MELPVPSLENIKAVWGWTLQRLQLWFQVIRDPAEVLRNTDLESTDSTIIAIQFAVFPVALTTLTLLPLFLMSSKETTIGIVGYFVIYLVMSALSIFIAAVAQFVAGTIVRGKASFNACTISVLFGTAYWPLLCLSNFSMVNHLDAYKRSAAGAIPTASDLLSVAVDLTLMIVIMGFLLARYAAMTAVVQQVGRLRAFVVCVFTGIVTVLVGYAAMGSLLNRLFGFA